MSGLQACIDRVRNSTLNTAPLNAWRTRCDPAMYGSAAFATQQGTAGPWLYDRGTALYRAYAVSSALDPQQSAYRETDLYRQRLLASSTTPPSSDLKYNYTQNLALHYLLTGDDRFREAASINSSLRRKKFRNTPFTRPL